MARRRAASTRGRFVPIAWIGGVASALLLALGVNGTLADWSTAIINNTQDTVASSNAVILRETGPGASPAVCTSSDGGFGNSVTCATINKYGGTGTPLAPGASQAVTVTMDNTGTASGTLTLSAGACAATGGQSGTFSVCSQLMVKVECPTGTAMYPATGSATLNAFNTATGTTPATVKTLGPGTGVACTFTVSLPSVISPVYAGQTASQPLTWTLS